MTRAALVLLSLPLVACITEPDAGDPPAAVDCLDATAPYVPFDDANWAGQRERLSAWERMVALRKAPDFDAADFAEMRLLYENTAELQAKVRGRVDHHDYASVPEIGPVLDEAILDAIEDGGALVDEEPAALALKLHGQVVTKTLSRFFYLSVYNYLAKPWPADEQTENEKWWDEAFGYSGIGVDAAEPVGPASALAKRQDEFGLELLEPTLRAFSQGRCMVANEQWAGLEEVGQRIDGALRDAYALSALHYMLELRDATAEEREVDGSIWGLEGMMYWDAVADWFAAEDPNAHAAIQAAFDAQAWDALDELDAAAVASELRGVLSLRYELDGAE